MDEIVQYICNITVTKSVNNVFMSEDYRRRWRDLVGYAWNVPSLVEILETYEFVVNKACTVGFPVDKTLDLLVRQLQRYSFLLLESH